MKLSLSLSQYVRRRTGVALGAPGSMQAMLYRALGAGSFAEFWRYWNPIWGYYLARNVMRPLRAYCSVPIATVVTFVVSGALHDFAVMLIKWRVSVFFSCWFSVMGLVVIGTEFAGFQYQHRPWLQRAFINLFFVFLPLLLVLSLIHI